MNKDLDERIERARVLLKTVRNAAMATVNKDGSPHNTPYLFMCDEKLDHLYWGSHLDSQHSLNVNRTGQIFVVLYEANERGGLYIQADEAQEAEGEELMRALEIHNLIRIRDNNQPIPISYYTGKGKRRMYMATPTNFWVNMTERDKNGLLIRDYRQEISKKQLVL